MNKIQSCPLVSITVITYNSSNFVIETLESVKAQTYQNIELIVSDDCSTDDTVNLCQQWINKNKERFVEIHLVASPFNTGIPANKNRAISMCRGEWLKSIAGDDLLLSNCILDNVENSHLNQETKIFLSRVKTLKNDVIFDSQVPIGIQLNFKSRDAEGQYNNLLLRYFGSSPSLFIAREVFEKVPFDESIKFMEDYPFALNATKAGYAFGFMNKETVIYRLHESSMMNTKHGKIFGDFYIKTRDFDIKYRYPHLLKKIVYKENFEYHRKLFLDSFNLNHFNLFCRAINKLSYIANPFIYF